MVQLYIKHTDNNFYLLDLEETENINFKLTVKDLNDITKIYSPFTQSFSLKATDKNKMLCGFIGNEKIQRANNNGEFVAKIYIAGFIFQTGVLTFEESEYEKQDQKYFKTTFANNLTSLSDKLGDKTIQDLIPTSDDFKIDWSVSTLKNRMTSITQKTLSNGIVLKYGIPFISNKRVWIYDDEHPEIIDNIAYKQTKIGSDVNYIALDEVRPAVNYMAIMKHIVSTLDIPVVCPLFDKPELTELYAFCNSESLVVPEAVAFPLVNYNDLVSVRYDFSQDAGAVTPPSIDNCKWLVSGGGASGIFKIKRNNDSGEQGAWSDGFDVNVKINGLVSLEGTETKLKVNLINAVTGIVLDSQEITGNTFTSRIVDPRSESPTMLDENGELYLKVSILPITLLKWDSLSFRTTQKFKYSRKVTFVKRTGKATYLHYAYNYTLSESLGGNKLNMITTLPKIKATDFLKSFFKTFNISVISTGLQDGSMYWLTPSDIQENNKAYSKRIVNYTSFVDTASSTKKKGNEYNQYSFNHYKSKYYNSVDGNDVYFGSLNYPTEAPTKPTKFEVSTDYSIIKQSNTFVHPSGARTCLAFEKDTPTTLDNGGNRYKPVYEEMTLFYLKPIQLGFDPVSVQLNNTTNNALSTVLEASYKNYTNGKTLSFGADNTLDTDTLYRNYYKDFIELLLRPNTYKTEFTVTLPPNEIFLNFSNLTQGESNIPMGFRAQNEIIIGEQRYTLVDSIINLTDGKGKINVLNF